MLPNLYAPIDVETPLTTPCNSQYGFTLAYMCVSEYDLNCMRMRKANNHIHEHEHILFSYSSSRILTLITHVSSHLMYAGVHHYTHTHTHTHRPLYTFFFSEKWGFISFMFQFQWDIGNWKVLVWTQFPMLPRFFKECIDPEKAAMTCFNSTVAWWFVGQLGSKLGKDETWKMWVLRMCLDPTKFGMFEKIFLHVDM